MAKKFEEYGYDDAQAALDSRQSPGTATAFAYYDGDHWQDGEGWKGPQFKGDDPSAAVIKEGVRKNFTSQNALRGGVRRHRRGVFGRVPGWTVTLLREMKQEVDAEGNVTVEQPTEAEQALIAEAYKVIQTWWSAHNALRAFRDALTNRLVGGRGPLAFYIPPSEVVTRADGRRGVRVSTPVEAARKIYPLTPRPEAAAVVTDPLSMRRASVRRVADGAKTHFEISFVGEGGDTVVATLEAGGVMTLAALIEKTKRFLLGSGDEESPGTYSLPLGGRLMLLETEGDALVTEQGCQNQALIAKGLTMLSHNMDVAGFREVTYFNARPAGRTVSVDDPASPGNKIDKFIPEPLPVGPGSRLFLEGKSFTDTDGSGKKITRLATPTAETTEPLDTKSFEDTAAVGRRNVLDDMDQLHVEIAAEATPSGRSRREAKDDYVKGLNESKLEQDPFVSGALETVLALVAYLSGRPDRYEGLRVSANCHVDPGPLSPEERKQIVTEKKERLRSRENSMEEVGIDDPDAMAAKIDEEEAADAERARKLQPVPDKKDGDEEGDDA